MRRQNDKERMTDKCRWFFEMAAEGYTSQEYSRYLESRPIELTSDELACCQEAWDKISRKLPYWRFQRIAKRLAKGLKKIGKVAAAVFLAICMLFSGAFLTVSSFRVKVLNFLLEMERTHTSIKVVEAPSLSVACYSPSAIPKEYRKTEIQLIPPYYTVVYENQNGDSIVFSQVPNKDGINYDTEDAQVEKITISGGKEALMISKQERISIIWYNEEYIFTLKGSLSKEAMITIAESTKIQT